MKFILTTLAFIMLSSVSFFATMAQVQAQDADEAPEPIEMFDTERNLYLVKINEHGAILKSEEAEETLFIGNDCDVVSPKHGKGSWLWAEKGIIVKFKDRRFVFGRQKLAVKNNGKCEMAL